MIEAVVKNTAEQYVKFRKFDAVQRDVAKTLAAPILLIFCAVLFLLLQSVVMGIIMLVCGVAFPLVMLFSGILGGKRYVRNYPDYLEITSRYLFTPERIEVTVDKPKPVKVPVHYEELQAVYETRKTFYLYINAERCMILPKDCLTSGTAEQRAAMLRTALDPYRKYIRKHCA